MPDPVYSIGIEMVSGSYTEITADVLRMNIYRQLSSPVERLRPGQADLILDNMHGDYSPDNPAGAYNGLLRPQLSVKIEASHGGNSYQLFSGYIDQIATNPDLERQRTCTIQCRDNFKKLYNTTITTSLYLDYNIGSAFIDVLSQTNIQSYAVDTILDEQPFIWFRDIKFNTAMDELMEEGFFFSFIGGDGAFNVKDRYFDLTQTVTASLNSFNQLEYSLSDDQVFNDVFVEGIPRETDPDTRSIAFIAAPIQIPASASVSFFLEYIDPDNFEPVPAIGQVAPVNSTDYQAFTNSDGTGTELTATTSASVSFFGQTALNTVFNGNGSPAWLTRYGIRGQPIHRRSRVSSNASDDSSQALYGEKTFRVSNEILGRQDHNLDYANFLLNRFKDPQPDIALSVVNVFPEVLAIELADKLVLIDSHTGITSQYIVKTINHDISLDNGLRHQLDSNVYRFRDSDTLILDDATYGLLDSRKLGF